MINPSHFEAQSPKRVLKQAVQFRDTFNQTIPLPSNRNKSMNVQEIANYNLEDVKYNIERAKYQNSVFRKLEELDIEKRNKLNEKLAKKQSKVVENKQKTFSSKLKKHQSYNKHISQVKTRYAEKQKSKFQHEKQEAEKLRKQIEQFYRKQDFRKKQKFEAQFKAPTEYQNALERINKIQKKNQEFGMKSQMNIEKQFSRNAYIKTGMDFKARSTSFDSVNKSRIFQNSQKLMEQKQLEHIQTMAKNETHSLMAFEHKEKQKEKVKKRIDEFFKKKIERWRQQKKRNDERRSQIPEKCLHIIEKTGNASFRKTTSAFRSSFSQWADRSIQKRRAIKQIDEQKKDQILQKHLDATIRNKSSNKLNETMLSMKQRASVVSRDFS